MLSVPSTASESEVKRAYRRLAMKFHPDRNPNDAEAEDKFKEAKEAYEVLNDPKKRSAYDQFGHAGVDATGGFGAGPGDFGAGGFSWPIDDFDYFGRGVWSLGDIDDDGEDTPTISDAIRPAA